MGYLGLRLKMYFKDYNSLEENGITKLNKKYYNENKEIVDEGVTKSKLSILKLIYTIVLTLLFIGVAYVAIRNNVVEPILKTSFPENKFLSAVYFFSLGASPIAFILFLIGCKDKSIRKSVYLWVIEILVMSFVIICSIILLYIGLHYDSFPA